MPGGDKAAYALIIVSRAPVSANMCSSWPTVSWASKRKQASSCALRETAENSPANIPTPVSEGGLIYTSSGKGGGGLVKLKSDKNGVVAEEVYYNLKNLPNSIGGAVVLNHFLYGTNNTGLMCVEFATGKQKWQQPMGGAGAVCYADGRLYLHGENGSVSLIDATPEAYHESGHFTPPDLRHAPMAASRRGPTRWSPLAVCTSTIRTFSGVMTSRPKANKRRLLLPQRTLEGKSLHMLGIGGNLLFLRCQGLGHVVACGLHHGQVIMDGRRAGPARGPSGDRQAPQ